MRVDGDKNLKKVATEVVKNPLQTQQEIADKTGLSVGNVNDKLKKVENIDKTDRIVRIEEKDLDIVDLGQEIVHKSLENLKISVGNGNALSASDIKQIASTAETSQKRYSILHGEATDPEGGDKLITQILDGIRNQSKGIDCPEISQ